MRRIQKVLISLVMFVSLSSICFAGIAGTAHDFSGAGWNSSGEICIVCHTPHNAQALTSAPLWNHTYTTQTFNVYSGFDLDATVGQPSEASKLCLSCHDGTVALDSFGGATGTNPIGSGSANLGTSLTNDHPISMTYDGGLASSDGGLKDPTSQAVAALLHSGKVECSSCHDVHDNTVAPFLRMSNTNSALCLTCHDK